MYFCKQTLQVKALKAQLDEMRQMAQAQMETQAPQPIEDNNENSTPKNKVILHLFSV